MSLNEKSIYTYSYRPEEFQLCKLEMRAFFGTDSASGTIESSIQVDPSRSPFMKERLDVLLECHSVEEVIENLDQLPINEKTFKVVFVKNPANDKWAFTERRSIERKIGLKMDGEVDLEKPQQLFGITYLNGMWLFGQLFMSTSIWLSHHNKPHGYSTALSPRLARSIVNIAIPDPTGVKAIDPCCGIGTVLIEASSMDITIEGSDINHRVVYRAKENLAHFGYETDVVLADMKQTKEKFDVAIIDMPYNLCSVVSDEEQLQMFRSARNFAKRVVIVTIDPVDNIIIDAGFSIVDRCKAGKNHYFFREVLVCE
ncbi:TRM11 family SAM-dependent methyltransferase [Salipaludibacillus sp. HK11]|uniref:TRM11 family SAM-dependent methyltransferase n=1 Tax=Salipaludibacillus sp. HK11 TaxID=3394320 RepID=UPI0039FD7BA9